MKPYYEDSAVRIYHGDCRNILPHLEPVDLVLTDPPYGLEFRHQEWDKHIPQIAFTLPHFAPSCIIVTAPLTIWDYPRPDWLACWYRPASNSRNLQGGFNHWSPILAYGDIKADVDVINLHALRHSYPVGFGHPSPKPLALMKWCLGFAPHARVVVDPFMGSGTTLRAVKDLGLKAIGIEIEERYCEIAAKRMSQEVLQFAACGD